MSHSLSSHRLAEAVLHGHHCEQEKSPKTPGTTSSGKAPAFTIAISREAGAKGARLAQALGERLGWPVYDRKLIEKIAGEMGLKPDLVEQVDEKQTSWLLECLQGFASGPNVSRVAYVRRLIKTLLSVASHGDCIIVGRGAAQVLSPASTLRVRLVAPREDRIRTVQQRHGYSATEAARWVDEVDSGRSQFVKDHFHKDPDDSHLYDLVLNSSRLNEPMCVELVVTALHLMQVHAASHGAAVSS